MAGIAGIISKNSNHNLEFYRKPFKGMMRKLAYSDNQLSQSYYTQDIWFGNVIPISEKNNDKFCYEESIGVYAIIEGLVFVDNVTKELLRKSYPLSLDLTDSQLLPFLFKYYQEQLVHHITGTYNIFIFDQKSNAILLFNDRLGYLPLYYYENSNILIFSSKIESLLESGLIENIDFDVVTIVEHLLFNYPISDHTYIKHINTLPDASKLKLSENEIKIDRYWDISELYGLNSLNRDQSIDAIDEGLKLAINKVSNNYRSTINFSLTGGWDSRVVLSYFLPEHRHLLNTYSFGAPGASDIIIPKLIAEKEDFDYTPIILDDTYLDEHFLQEAADTIMLSNGSRNYKRSHYLYAIKQIAEISPLLITGIFGDDIFKVGKPKAGTVISENGLSFIETGFNVESMLSQFESSRINSFFSKPASYLKEDFETRLLRIKARYSKYSSSGERYFAFRFSLILRKYFGSEANSYNDFVNSYSPFIDHDFLTAYASTKYMGSRYEFLTSHLKTKVYSTWLYSEIVSRNYHNLTKYASSRGYSMSDTNTIFGLPKIVFNKYLKIGVNKGQDAFNTKNVDQLFANLESNRPNNDLPISPGMHKHNKPVEPGEDLLSLVYWCDIISERYIR